MAAMNKKSGILKDDRKSKARLIEELRAAKRKIAAFQRKQAAHKFDEISFRLFFDNSGDAVLLTRPDGTISAANPEACRMFGRSEKEITKIGRSGIVDLLDPRLPGALKKRRRTGLVKGELNYKKKDGTVIPCDFTSKIFRDPSGSKSAITIIRDLTERKRMEEELARSEALFREAQGAAHIGHWELDTSIMTPAWSEEIFHIFGLDPEKDEPSFEAHQKVTHPDDWDILNNAVTTSIVKGTPFDIEFRILRPDKTIRWMHAIGYPKKDREGGIVSVFGTAQDITDRKSMEDMLRVSLEKYRVLFESFPLGITISDKSGKIIEGNRQSEQLLGITRGAHVQRRIDSKEWQIIRKDGTLMPADEYASTRALRENRPIENVEMGIVNDKDEITWINVTAAPIPLEGYGVAITYGDITARKRAEEEKRRLEERSRKIVEDIFRFIPEGVLVFSRKMELLRQNQAFRELVSGYAGRLGFVEDELENLIIDKIKAGLGDKNIKEIRISRKHETGK